MTNHFGHGENEASEGLVCPTDEDPVYGVVSATTCRGAGLREADQDVEIRGVEEQEVCGHALGGLSLQPGHPPHCSALLAL